jgi:DNA-binding GntR family transcriptional regulator
MANLSEEVRKALDNVPSFNELPEEVASILAYQAESAPKLFARAYPDLASLELRRAVLESIINMILLGGHDLRDRALTVEDLTKQMPETPNVEDPLPPLREALAILVRDGFLTQIQGEAAFQVVEISEDEALEALSLAGEVEALALEQLIASNEPNLKRLQAVHESLAGAMPDIKHQGLMFGDTEFHTALLLSVGLPIVARSVRSWRQKVHLYSVLAEGWEVDIKRTIEEHGHLIEAVSVARNAGQVAAIDQSRQAIDLLDQHLEGLAVQLGFSESEPPT